MKAVEFVRVVLEPFHCFLHDHSFLPTIDRPKVRNTGFFEDYLDYYHNTIHVDDEKVSWMGINAKKFPMDAWIYQEMIHEIRPDVIIEIGNANGGSTLFLANLLDLENNGRVIGIDIDHSEIDFQHPRITWITGDATHNEVISKVRSLMISGERVMIIEDSSHTFDNTLAVLRSYESYVSVGSYFIVEDGVCRYPFVNGPKPGPYEAVQQFLRENSDFTVDRSREKFVLTYNPNGYLKRVK